MNAAAVIRLTLAGARRRGIGQVLALVLVSAFASAAIVAGLASRTTNASLVDAAYERANHPDLVLYGTPDALRAAATDGEVAAASEPVARGFGQVQAGEVTGSDPVDISVMAIDPTRLPAVGTPELVEGRWPAAADEITVEHSVLVEGVVALGGRLTITNPSGSFEVRVVGSAIELSDCFYTNRQCDPLRAFGTPTLVDELNAGLGLPQAHVAWYRLVDPERAAAVGTRLLRDEGPLPGLGGQNHWPDTRGDILIIGEVFGAMVAGFGAFLLGAACFVVAGATAARMVARRRSLGLLRAVGFRTGQLTASIVLEHAVIGAVGVGVGWLVGSLAAPNLGGVATVLDTGAGTFEPGALVAALGAVEALLALAVVVPAWRAGRLPATEVLRDVPLASGAGRAIGVLARRLGAGPSLVVGLRRAVARPARAALASAALLVAAVGTIVAAGFIGGIDRATADPAVIGHPYDASVFGPVDDGLTAALATMPTVQAWFTERETRAAVGDGLYLTRALGGDPAAAGYRVGGGRALTGPGEALVGYGFLQDTGLDVGDPFTATIGGSEVDLHVVGWYLETSDAGRVVLVREESLPTVPDGSSTIVRVVAARGVAPEELVAAVAPRAGPLAFVLAGDPDVGGLRAVTGTLYGFAALLAGVAAANLAATTVAATRERARALGVLRTVGCTTRQLIGQAAAGGAVLGLAAGLVGAPLGWFVFQSLADAMASGVGIGPGLAPGPPGWFLAAVVPATTALAAAAGALSSLGLSRRPAAELVRFE